MVAFIPKLGRMDPRRRAMTVLAASLLLAVAVTVTGVLVGTSPQRMVLWMIASLVILALGMWAYGHLTREKR